MVDVERNFHQKGAVVIMSTIVKDEELTDKEVMESIDGFDKRIEQAHSQILQMEEQIKTVQKQVEDLEIARKKIKKFEEWALEHQLAKVKNIVETELKGATTKIDETYKWDQALTDEQNKRQKYAQLQRTIATTPSARDLLAPEIIKKYMFEESIIVNPFQ